MPSATSSGSNGLGLRGLAVPRASDVLAARLRDRILRGELAEGRMLPVERLIADESGLSRGTVREALRILEIEGLLVTRPGRAGGSFVQRPGPQIVEHNLGVFIRGARIGRRELLEAREAVEPAAAELAARHRTAADLARLAAVTERVERAVDDVPAYLRENVAWHVTVAGISHNELVHVFMRSLSTAIHAGTDLADFNSADVRRAALAAHRRVVAAIADGDAERARHAMSRHVHAFAEQAEHWAGATVSEEQP